VGGGEMGRWWAVWELLRSAPGAHFQVILPAYKVQCGPIIGNKPL